MFSCLAALASGTPLQAGDPAPWPEFTFRRIAPPTNESGRLITVQIPENAARQPVATDEPAGPGPALDSGGADFAWFWSTVSPALADSGPGRLAMALEGLDQAPAGAAVPSPGLQPLTDIARAYGADILLATAGTRVSPALVLAVIGVESSGRAAAVSHAGATGLMQLMPETAARFGVEDAAVAAENIRGGVAYLDWLMGEFDGDPVIVLAGYNAGENAVRRHDGVPPFTETRDYVPKVLAAWAVARRLCLTPPELVSDGCVFAVPGRSDG